MLYAIEHKGKIVDHIEIPTGEVPTKSVIVSRLNRHMTCLSQDNPGYLSEDQCLFLMFNSCYGQLLDSRKIIATVFRS